MPQNAFAKGGVGSRRPSSGATSDQCPAAHKKTGRGQKDLAPSGIAMWLSWRATRLGGCQPWRRQKGCPVASGGSDPSKPRSLPSQDAQPPALRVHAIDRHSIPPRITPVSRRVSHPASIKLPVLRPQHIHRKSIVTALASITTESEFPVNPPYIVTPGAVAAIMPPVTETARPLTPNS